ncbi:MAG: hypothetical protein G3M78_14895 [Candidatus Nitrohelix vancouverensis]|uniref:Uncharacterized protein n=1 Tax=Candidatus Nitrohelix vancouverensis TaxID=2705534 RepID=A0A7T0G4L5_9BACT|nr:MAG: hypothetical protein G3M78_14895 [Candidatus Nitrohelix vancouverensis]
MTLKVGNKPNLREWVRDRILFLAVAILIVGGIGYVTAGNVLDHDSIWLHPVKEFALLMSLIGVVSLGYELFLRELTFNEYKDALQELMNPDAVRLGIIGIYKNRSELGQATSFEKLFKNVKKEIFIGGSSLLSISTSSRELLKEKILEGVDVKLLLMDPNSRVVDLIVKQGGGKPTFVNEIKTSLLLLQKLQMELDDLDGKPRKGTLQVHTYEQIPSHSFISIDGNSSEGVIIADIGPYLGRSLPRPSMIVVRKKNGMYDYWVEMNQLMWEESKPINLESPTLLESGAKTSVFTSGRETECWDAKTGSWTAASICRMGDHWRTMKGSQWVWARESLTLEEVKTGGQQKFRVKFHFPCEKSEGLLRAELLLRADNECRVRINATQLNGDFAGAQFKEPYFIDLRKHVQCGDNELLFELVNFAKPGAQSPEDGVAGLIYRLHLEYRT